MKTSKMLYMAMAAGLCYGLATLMVMYGKDALDCGMSVFLSVAGSYMLFNVVRKVWTAKLI